MNVMNLNTMKVSSVFNKMRKGVGAILAILVLMLLSMPLNAIIGQAVKTYKTPGQHPRGMCFDGKNIWISDSGTDKIYAINPLNGEVVKTLDAPGYEPRGLAWDGKLLWCNDAIEGWLYGLNIETGIAEKILESNAANPGGLAFDGQYLWLLDKGANKFLKINRIDGMMHENIPAPSDRINDMTFDGKYLWSTDNADDILYRSDPKNGDVVAFIGSVGPYPTGVCWDGKTLWNVDYQNAELYCLDLESKDFIVRKNPKEIHWDIIQEFRNYGPGEVLDVNAYIAIPKNMNNQELTSEISYNVKPQAFVKDDWDQEFAHFNYSKVEPGQTVKSILTVKSKHYQTEYYIFPERVGALNLIPKELGKYLEDGFKYDIKNPIIQKAVKEAIGDEKNPYWMMRKIFNYIIAKIDYNLKPLGGWNPAPTVLERGTGSCSEYSFVFIAMCRAAGLPARYVGSVVVRDQDKGIDDVWHRWPEVYLPNYGWIPADPSAEARYPTPGGKARLIGVVGNKYLITTQNGGASKYLDFYYNFNVNWKTQGKSKILSQHYAEFFPLNAKPEEKLGSPGRGICNVD